MTPQERLDWLLETVEKPNTQTVLTGSLIDSLGYDNARVVLASMQAIGKDDPIVSAAYQALVTVGITLYQPDRQAMIAAIGEAAQWPSELTAAVQVLGKTTGPRWQVDNLYQAEPTLSDATRDVLRDRIKAKTTAIVGWLDTLDTSEMTPEQVADYVQTLVDSEDGNP